MLANGQMGVFCLAGNEVFLTNFPSNPSLVHGFSFSKKPILGVTLNCAAIIKGRVFNLRIPQCRTVNAMTSGEIEACSANVRSFEKEFKFSPTFDEYVKVMESVRTDRSKNLNVDENGCRLKKRSTGKDAASSADNRGNGKLVKLRRQSAKAEDINREERKKEEEVWLNKGKIGRREKRAESKNVERLVKQRKSCVVESSNSGWDMVQGLLEKGTIRRIGNQDFGTLDCKGSYGGLKDDGKSNLYSKYDGVGQNVNDRYSEKKKVSHLRNNLKRWIDQPDDERDAGRIDELKTSNKVKVSGSEEREFENINYSTNVLQQHKLLELNRTSAKEYAGRVRRGMGDTKIDNVKNKQTERRQVERKIPEIDIDDDGQSMHDMDENHNDNNTHTTKRSTYGSVKNVNSQDRNQSHVTFHPDAVETKNVGSRAIEMLGNHGLESSKIAGRDIDDVDIEDRAAFKTFEVFTDVKNRSRVLRMEMEERIQKLAKRLNATDVNMPEWQFSKMMHGAKIKFTDHSILRVVQILGALGNWKRVLQVVEWLQSRERFKSYKSRYIYTTVLDVLGKAKRPFEALNVFYAMHQELSSYPDLAAYHCVAVTLGQAGLMKELFDVIDCMRATPEKKFNLGPLQKWDPRLEPDLVVYNAVLNACIQQKQWEGAFWVLQQLKQQNIKPSNTTYGLVMEVMLACGKYSLVHEFFKKVAKTSIPGELNYKVLVNTLWREGRIDEAVQAVKDMERRGIVGSAGLYYDLARCLCSTGRCQEALRQIDKICKVAKKPLVVTYTGLIQACLDSGSIENATYIFNQMHKFCSPNIVTCNIMLKSYIEKDMFNEANNLFYKILDDSHQIFSKSDVGRVVPDKFSFNIMMEACAKAKKWDDFETAYQEMLHHGYHFDAKRHLRMVLDAFRAGKGRVLEVTWAYLVHFGRPPPPPIIKERFCLKLEDEEPRAAISCIGVSQEKEMHAFSEKSWLNLLWSNASRFKTDTIFRLVEELRDFSAATDRPHPVYQNLLHACSRFLSQATNSVNSANDQQTLSCIS